ncbi:hypothetical protein [Rhizosaccharibacter radicis]|uniref:Peptidoglycan binding-like domain-containing protein n=1 Tax=Rhizosaccharibacter radicis TaxID=2782605 RepID=A0ABT1VZG5_9PROT|nr:hypothetical protein [Acetobacteraceae bacterium KSS12]
MVGLAAVTILGAPPARASEAAGNDGVVALIQDAQPFLLPALGDALERGDGRPANWSSPDRRLTGTVAADASADPSDPSCRGFRYVIHAPEQSVAVAGERCRTFDRRWVPGPAADRASILADADDPAAPLAAALRRLRYLPDGDAGIVPTDDRMRRALLAFEHDEQLPPEAAPTEALLSAARRAVARIPSAGTCGEAAGPAVRACGRGG